MTTPCPNRITVRVEVAIDGCQATVVQSEERHHPNLFDLANPSFGGNTPVTIVGGVKYVSASGTAPIASGKYPATATALAYDTAGVSSSVHQTPEGGSVTVNVNQFTGAWSLPSVPGANCDGVDGGPNNSTLIVWYNYGTPSSPVYSNVAASSFHGYCPGQPMMMIHTPEFASGPKATTLHATFTGSLSALHSVKLVWNGVSWVGEATAGGGCVLIFQCNNNVYQLMSAGPGTAFVVAGRSGGCATSFVWNAAGSALGSLSGPFGVTITE